MTFSLPPRVLGELLNRLEQRYTHTGIPACPECGVGGSDYEVVQLVGIVREVMAAPAGTPSSAGELVATHERNRVHACTHNTAHAIMTLESSGATGAG